MLRRGSAFQSSTVLDALARGWPGVRELRRFGVYRSGRLVAAAPMLTADDCPRLNYYRTAGRQPFEAPCLMSHALVGWEGLPVAEDADALQALLDALDDAAALKKGQTIFFAGIPEERTDLLQALRDHGYAVRWFHTTMQQVLRPEHADDRLMYLPRRRRERIRNAISKCRRGGVQILAGHKIGVQQVLELYARQMAALGVAADVLSTSFLEALLTGVDPMLEVHAALLPCGRIVGHAICCAWGKRYYLWLAAYDPDVTGELPISHAMYAQVLQAAWRKGASVVDAGRSPYDIKRRHGFTPVRLMAAVRAPHSDNQSASTWLKDLEYRHLRTYPELGIAGAN